MDTSDHMRNGDYEPTRLEAQYQAVRLLMDIKLEGAEDTIGFVSNGPSVVLRAPTAKGDSKEELVESIRGLKAAGSSDFLSAVKVAALAIHNRANKTGSARIVVFVGSPVDVEDKALKKAAAGLRKTGTTADVVLIESDAVTRAKMETFIGAMAKDGRESSLVVVPAGSNLTDSLFSSPVVGGGGGAAAASAAGGMGGGGGADADVQAAMRASLEEQAARETAAGAGQPAGGAAAAEAAADSHDGLNVALLRARGVDMSQDAMMLRVIQQSIEDDLGPDGVAAVLAAAAADDGADGAGAGGLPPDIDVELLRAAGIEVTDDVGLMRAIQESLRPEPAAAPSPGPAGAAAGAEDARVPSPAEQPAGAGASDSMRDILADMPGIDMSDPEMADALAALTSEVDAFAAEQAAGAAEGDKEDEAGTGGAAKRPRRDDGEEDGGGDGDAGAGGGTA